MFLPYAEHAPFKRTTSCCRVNNQQGVSIPPYLYSLPILKNALHACFASTS